MQSGRNPNDFKPEIAKLSADDLFVGDAIVNLPNDVPSFRFQKSTVSLRIEMSGNRQFETKLIFLGHGSTQVLYVDIGDTKADGIPKITASVPRPAGQ